MTPGQDGVEWFELMNLGGGQPDLGLANQGRWNKLCARMLRDLYWVKARIGARILLRAEAGTLTARDVRWARRLSADRGVEPRLLDQAVSCIRVEKRKRFEHVSAQ